jgi:hypothetical protein
MNLTSTDRSPRATLVGRTWRGGFTIDPAAHDKFCRAVFAEAWSEDDAHPLFLHLVAHCGKGLPLDEFFAELGTELEAGVTFGEGRLESYIPLRIGATYRVDTTVHAVERKAGRRGPFDVVTCRIEMRNDDHQLVGVSHESYVVPLGPPDDAEGAGA